LPPVAAVVALEVVVAGAAADGIGAGVLGAAGLVGVVVV
jgi:hypothetical protein